MASVRSLACDQATAPKVDEQGAHRWWAVRKVCVPRGRKRVRHGGKWGNGHVEATPDEEGVRARRAARWSEIA